MRNTVEQMKRFINDMSKRNRKNIDNKNGDNKDTGYSKASVKALLSFDVKENEESKEEYYKRVNGDYHIYYGRYKSHYLNIKYELDISHEIYRDGKTTRNNFIIDGEVKHAYFEREKSAFIYIYNLIESSDHKMLKEGFKNDIKDMITHEIKEYYKNDKSDFAKENLINKGIEMNFEVDM